MPFEHRLFGVEEVAFQTAAWCGTEVAWGRVRWTLTAAAAVEFANLMGREGWLLVSWGADGVIMTRFVSEGHEQKDEQASPAWGLVESEEGRQVIGAALIMAGQEGDAAGAVAGALGNWLREKGSAPLRVSAPALRADVVARAVAGLRGQ
jgi:hypothetical protein